jgi:hypothetical protein
LLLLDGREIVIANADDPTTQSFASLIKDELHEWKFQLKIPGAILQFILFGKHFSPRGALHLNLDCAEAAHVASIRRVADYESTVYSGA